MTNPTPASSRSISYGDALEEYADTGRILHVVLPASVDADGYLVVHFPTRGHLLLEDDPRIVRIEVPPLPIPDRIGAIIDATVKTYGDGEPPRRHLVRVAGRDCWASVHHPDVQRVGDDDISEIHHILFDGVTPITW